MMTYLARVFFDAVNTIPQRHLLNKYPPRYGLYRFLLTLPPNARLLDVGCGNESPQRIKAIVPKVHYTGIDVTDWNQHSHSFADSYHLTTPNAFADAIRDLSPQFDAVVWNHNIEHCNEPYRVLLSIVSRMKSGARLYLAMPCAASVTFPKRAGTLNYYDDWTHQHEPPAIALVTDLLRSYGLTLIVNEPRYRPTLWAAVGLAQEPFSYLRKTIYGGTWALYGFESVIWATKL
jgi:SAM-dependent methyltransferase